RPRRPLPRRALRATGEACRLARASARLRSDRAPRIQGIRLLRPLRLGRRHRLEPGRLIRWARPRGPTADRTSSVPSPVCEAGAGHVRAGGGLCAPPEALKSLPANAALIEVEENARVGGEPYQFPPRPRSMELGPALAASPGVKEHSIGFEEGGRYLSVRAW